MAKIKLTVIGTLAVDGHDPGDSFFVDEDDPRARRWQRAHHVRVSKPRKKRAKK